MSLPDLVVKIPAKDKTALAKSAKAILSMKKEDGNVGPVGYLFPCTEGEFDELGFVIVPPVAKESKGPSDRVFTRSASWEENMLGAETDNEQVFRVKDGVEQRRVNGVWVKSLAVTTGKSSIPAHIRVFGHKNGIVEESIGMVLTYTSPNEYIIGVQTKFGSVPRTIKIISE